MTKAADANILISADSHVVEPITLWQERLPKELRDKAPVLKERTGDQPGATNPFDREEAMRKDGVSMEVIYPTYGLSLFGIEDPLLQEACFSVYNDYIVEYCQVMADRLVGVPMIPAYDVQNAIKELERSLAMGLKGAMLWHVPPEGLSYSSSHYDELWAACQEMDVPVNLHILTGFSYSKNAIPDNIERYRGSVEIKLLDAIHVLFDFIFYGVLERFPRLKLVLVEFEIGWLPWLLQQWDFYAQRFAKVNPTQMTLLPSEYFARQVSATFVKDGAGATHFSSGWGVQNCLWSNDFPHGNTSWPRSAEIISRDLGGLDEATTERLLWKNTAELYHLDVPAPLV